MKFKKVNLILTTKIISVKYNLYGFNLTGSMLFLLIFHAHFFFKKLLVIVYAIIFISQDVLNGSN